MEPGIQAPAPLADNLPKSFYRASNLGVTHETELIGFPDPVIIENLQPAPLSSAGESAPCG